MVLRKPVHIDVVELARYVRGFLNQDFNILSYTDGTPENACGHWGCGNSFKEIIDLGAGNFEYRLRSTSGEPHGTIQFTGAFDTLQWNSLSPEVWNGFTVGVQGTQEEFIQSQVPEPSTVLLLAGGLAALGARRWKNRQRG